MSDSNRHIVERYISACTAADRDELLDVLAEDAVHYFSPHGMKPVEGANQIAQLWLDAHSVKPRWTIDNLVHQNDQVVIEYTNAFLSDPDDPSTKTFNRGCEWYRIESGKITEIRAYFESDYDRDSGLTEYPYDAMGYTTKREDE